MITTRKVGLPGTANTLLLKLNYSIDQSFRLKYVSAEYPTADFRYRMQLTELELIDEQTIEKKVELIKQIFKDKKVIVAFSGGVDSSVLAVMAREFCKKVQLVMQNGYSVGIGELELAKQTADLLNLNLKFLYYNEFELNERYAENPHNRCYFCKELLHSKLEQLRIELGYDFVVNGTNASDLLGHRPGYQAVIENKAKSPLVKVDLTKSEIRWIAKKYNLPTWNKPATACLASRFQTGMRITKEGLQRVAKAEHYIKSRFDIQVLRVRCNDSLAKIEVGLNEISKLQNAEVMDEIIDKLTTLGYSKITVDPKGYRPYEPLE